jgi:hypothetical protein
VQNRRPAGSLAILAARLAPHHAGSRTLIAPRDDPHARLVAVRHAMVLAIGYFIFISRNCRGKVQPDADLHG